MTSHITSFTQMPAAMALTDPRGAESVESMRQQFEKRGRHMWERLGGSAEGHLRPAAGRVLLLPQCQRVLRQNRRRARITDAVSFAAALLEQSHVAVVPGNDSGFDTHVRLSFATSMEQIDKGIDRIAEFLKGLGG